MKLVTKVWRVVPALMCILFWATVWGQEARKGVDDPFEAYQSDRPKTILDLQPFRSTVSAVIEDGTGRQGTATLVDVNPRVNVWYLLTLEWADGTRDVYHLENPRPDLQTVTVDARYPYGPVFITNKLRDACDLWKDRKVLSEAQASGVPYAPVCNGRLYVRNPTKGHKTTLEWGADFLRNYVPRGEQITNFVKAFYRDSYLDTSSIFLAQVSGAARLRLPGSPAMPLVDPAYIDHSLIPAELGIELENEAGEQMLVGRWYPARGLPGIFISVMEPRLVAPEVVLDQQRRVNPLDAVESAALVYLVAFDLERFDLEFALGTEHPKVGWSERTSAEVLDASLPGPNGIDTVAPLVRTGMVSPVNADRVVAAFIGGFKRSHGVFPRGDLAGKNHGNHYGFMESGTVLSKLQPGLATAIVYADGKVDLKSWTEADGVAQELRQVRHARQNGVPIVQYDASTGLSLPGEYIVRPGGNWSGSVDGRYRTLRAGLALQEQGGNRFLIYGYFSSVTPSAMARVFQAYQCRYAMLLDMNALEHTYLAVYRVREGQFQVQHLVRGMHVLDRSNKGVVAPRFVGYADNRDFFYLLKKER